MEGISIRKIGLFLTLLFLLTGCTSPEQKIQFKNAEDRDVEKAEKIFRDEKRIEGAVAVFSEKDLLVGMQVEPFARFRKTKIEQEIHKKLEKAYPENKVTVSADLKIYREAKKLIDDKSEKKISKKIKDLKKLSKEET